MPTHPLIEAWTPRSETLKKSQALLFDEAGDLALSPVSDLFKQKEGLIEQTQIAGMETVLFAQASPHIDSSEFGRWFVLWVAKTHGQTLHAKRTLNEKDKAVAQESVALTPGDVVILDAHRLHWTTMTPPLLTVGQEESAYEEQIQQRFAAAVVFDCDKRPTRQDAEKQLEMMVATCDWNKPHIPTNRKPGRYNR